MHPYLTQLIAKARRDQFLAEAEQDRALAVWRRQRRDRMIRRLTAPAAFVATRARDRRTARPEPPDLEVCTQLAADPK
jgi:hypothetical protein